MASTDKALKIAITADSTQLGAATKQAVGQLNEVKSAAMSMLQAFTGGLIGGGVVGTVQTVVSLVSAQIKEARQLLKDAKSADLDRSFLRGARMFGASINAPENTVEMAIGNARQARSDALGGDLNAIENFRRLGIALQEIERMAPEELFERISKAFKDGDLSKNRLAAGAAILGVAQAQALIPYMAGGSGGSLNMSEMFRTQGSYMNMIPGVGALRTTGYANAIDSGKFKQDIEPITFAGIGNEERTARLRAQNDQQALANKRALMTIEEQISDIVKTRAKLEVDMAKEGNSYKKEQIRTSILGLEADTDRLRKEAARMPNVSALSNSQRDVDQFARMGLFIGGGRGVTLQEQQVNLLREVKHVLEQSRSENERNWG